MTGKSLYDDWEGFAVIGGDGTAIAWYSEGVGFIEQHTAPDGTVHAGSVMIDPTVYPASPHWVVEAGTAGVTEGLTLSPSIACRTCGHHGWIRDGRWVDA